MKWSLRIAKIAGIDVYLHWTFLILLVWIGSSLLLKAPTAGTYSQFWFVLLLFIFVLLHEFGHALMGQRFGVKTSHITLLPIGGVASMDRMPEKPWQEFWIAIAGPAVNLVLAIGISVLLLIQGAWVNFSWEFFTTSDNIWFNLLSVNLMLFGFNLIPAFPMDGGRVLRALLTLRFDRAKATGIAARIGQVLAIGFVFFGLYANIWLMFIGIFIYLGAGAEASYEGTHSLLVKYTVQDALMHQHTVLQTHYTVAQAVQQLLDGQEKEFLVSDGHTIVGAVTRDELIAGLGKIGQDGEIGEILNRNLIPLAPHLPLEEVFLQMTKLRVEICPVYQDGKLVGALNRENIIELLMVANAKMKS